MTPPHPWSLDSPLAAGSPKRALRSNIDYLGVPRDDKDPADMFGLFQAHVLPVLTAILAFVNTIAIADRTLTVNSPLPAQMR